MTYEGNVLLVETLPVFSYYLTEPDATRIEWSRVL